jgi:hypothetical protein
MDAGCRSVFLQPMPRPEGVRLDRRQQLRLHQPRLAGDLPFLRVSLLRPLGRVRESGRASTRSAGPLCVGSSLWATATSAARRAGRGRTRPVRQRSRSRRRARTHRPASVRRLLPARRRRPTSSRHRCSCPRPPPLNSTHTASIREPIRDRAASWIDGTMLNSAGHRSSQCMHSSHRLATSATVLHWSSATGSSPCFAR